MGVKKTRERRDKACMDTLECLCSPILTAALSLLTGLITAPIQAVTPFEKKKKVKSYLRPSLATGLVPQRWMGLKARVKTKRIGQITGISKVCVHGRVAAFLKITTHQMD